VNQPNVQTSAQFDEGDLRTALAVVSYFRRAHQLSNRPIPPAADKLAERLTGLLAVNGQECFVPQQEWLTTRQVASRLQCSQRTARRIAAQVGRKPGREWQVPAEAIPEEDRG
jgi:hypothetical protein